jgi:hypothetical protein
MKSQADIYGRPFEIKHGAKPVSDARYPIAP